MRYPLLLLSGLLATTCSFSQNIGIGTTTPLYKLTVQTPNNSYGMVHTNGNIRIGTYTGSSILAGEGAWLGTLSNHPLYLFTVGSDPQLTLTQNGYVGINTMSPFGALDVRRIPGSLGTAFFNGTTYGSVFHYSTTEDIYFRGGKAGSHVIINDVAPLGNVGIGTDAPFDKLTVKTGPNSYGFSHTDGTITVSTYLATGGGWFGTRTNHPLRFFVGSGGPQLTLQTNGRVTFANEGFELPGPFVANWNVRAGTANANLYFNYDNVDKAGILSTDGTYFQLSDARFKRNILPYKPVLNGIKKLKVSTYEYITDVTGQRCFGLIAQNAAQYFPEIVAETTGKDGKKLLSVAYGKTGVLALKAIQEQQEIIESLQKQVEAAKSEIPMRIGKQQVIIESQQQKIEELETRLLRLEKIIKKN